MRSVRAMTVTPAQTYSIAWLRRSCELPASVVDQIWRISTICQPRTILGMHSSSLFTASTYIGFDLLTCMRFYMHCYFNCVCVCLCVLHLLCCGYPAISSQMIEYCEPTYIVLWDVCGCYNWYHLYILYCICNSHGSVQECIHRLCSPACMQCVFLVLCMYVTFCLKYACPIHRQ